MRAFRNTPEAQAIREQRWLRRNAPDGNSQGFIALCLDAAGIARRRGDKAQACAHLEAVMRERQDRW